MKRELEIVRLLRGQTDWLAVKELGELVYDTFKTGVAAGACGGLLLAIIIIAMVKL